MTKWISILSWVYFVQKQRPVLKFGKESIAIPNMALKPASLGVQSHTTSMTQE